MDPQSRRLLWDSIVSVLRDGRAVVLTSHRYRAGIQNAWEADIHLLAFSSNIFFLFWKYGRMRSSLYSSSHHGKWYLQVPGHNSAAKIQVSWIHYGVFSWENLVHVIWTVVNTANQSEELLFEQTNFWVQLCSILDNLGRPHFQLHYATGHFCMPNTELPIKLDFRHNLSDIVTAFIAAEKDFFPWIMKWSPHLIPKPICASQVWRRLHCHSENQSSKGRAASRS